ncbi:hypothetical protein TH3_02410 [Thalassospira xiamenensis M-5 = DSM 17429]|uniref:Uncharacterized protein n=1 Tax=Thalassospira xiamenensis M-5 = DSM 17429 TaxID=1123366 RepID=A0AB72U8N1_9PROT|nr:hypothetical protein TH3_02410 [Thalassospira xiamenensis M-5 = DSM 17429]
MAGTNPAIDHQPFGIFERSIGPLATDPACHPGTPAPRPADPVPTQFGRNSGPLLLGIVTLHRPDKPRPEQTPAALG